MNNFFKYKQALMWAMSVLENSNKKLKKLKKLVLNVKDLDATSRWFLYDNHYAPLTSRVWEVSERGDELFFATGFYDFKEPIYIHLFDIAGSTYVGLYDSTGKRCFDICLIIWNNLKMEIANQGYAPGRCPESI
jgi:hypothetical protein